MNGVKRMALVLVVGAGTAIAGTAAVVAHAQLFDVNLSQLGQNTGQNLGQNTAQNGGIANQDPVASGNLDNNLSPSGNQNGVGNGSADNNLNTTGGGSGSTTQGGVLGGGIANCTNCADNSTNDQHQHHHRQREHHHQPDQRRQAQDQEEQASPLTPEGGSVRGGRRSRRPPLFVCAVTTAGASTP